MWSMLREVVAEAFAALRRNRTRSSLTMLGIVWGIVSVTLLIAYGNGFRSVLWSPLIVHFGGTSPSSSRLHMPTKTRGGSTSP